MFPYWSLVKAYLTESLFDIELFEYFNAYMSRIALRGVRLVIRNGGLQTTLELADRLLAYEKTLDRTSQAEGAETCPVCEKLRLSLGKLAGPEAYRVLVERALTTATRQAPILATVQVETDGSLQNLVGEAIIVINILISHLVALMQELIGDTVTLWILNDIWPDLPGTT